MSTPNPCHESPFAFHIAVKRVRLTLVIEEKISWPCLSQLRPHCLTRTSYLLLLNYLKTHQCYLHFAEIVFL